MTCSLCLLHDNRFSCLHFRDLCSAFGAQIYQHLEKPTILELLQEGRRSKGGKTKNVATWATKELRKLKQA
jgi:importin subunit beta-1